VYPPQQAYQTFAVLKEFGQWKKKTNAYENEDSRVKRRKGGHRRRRRSGRRRS